MKLKKKRKKKEGGGGHNARIQYLHMSKLHKYELYNDWVTK